MRREAAGGANEQTKAESAKGEATIGLGVVHFILEHETEVLGAIITYHTHSERSIFFYLVMCVIFKLARNCRKLKIPRGMRVSHFLLRSFFSYVKKTGARTETPYLSLSD